METLYCCNAVVACYNSTSFVNPVLSPPGRQWGKDQLWNNLGEAIITDLDFSDNVVIFAETLEALVQALDILSTESEPFGSKIS